MQQPTSAYVSVNFHRTGKVFVIIT